ncbi:MAG: RtcB family protein [archaeon]
MPEIKKISENIWEIPKSGNMLVPAKIYASDKLMEHIRQDKTIDQVRNVACLKGIQKHSLAMPDAHQGYGFSIGGVAAFDMNEGIISPGGVGYDINCGVRAITTNLKEKDIIGKEDQLLNILFTNIPSGLASKGRTRVSKSELIEIIENGAKWAVNQGYGTKKDLDHTEEYGCIKSDHETISPEAMKRGMPQTGSLGSGNHFLEFQKVEEIYDQKTAKAFGINNTGQVTIMIHCGSRGLGHQVASDYIRSMEKEYGFKDLPDRELINAPIQSELGQRYLKAMSGAANYAWTNRQMIMHWVRESFAKIFDSTPQDLEMNQIYDVAHNIAKIEKHDIDGSTKEVCVHRKGATRSFGPGRTELPAVYQKTGQPVIIPGSMGTSSYILVGTKTAENISFGSTAHGAGRIMSRFSAIKSFRGEKVKQDLQKLGITVKSASWKGLAEEAPEVYKDIDEVVKVSNNLGIGNLVAKVRPLGVIKG